MESKDPLAAFPTEVSLTILSFLPSVQSLVTVGLVCHHWRDLTEGTCAQELGTYNIIFDRWATMENPMWQTETSTKRTHRLQLARQE